MRIVIQRTSRASVSIDGVLHASIGKGQMILVGCERGDTRDDADWLAAKAAALRIFDDADGVMNLSVADIGGEILHQPVHPDRLHTQRQPPQLHTRLPRRGKPAALRIFLRPARINARSRQSEARRVWCRHESGTGQRRPRDHNNRLTPTRII